MNSWTIHTIFSRKLPAKRQNHLGPVRILGIHHDSRRGLDGRWYAYSGASWTAFRVSWTALVESRDSFGQAVDSCWQVSGYQEPQNCFRKLHFKPALRGVSLELRTFPEPLILPTSDLHNMFHPIEKLKNRVGAAYSHLSNCLSPAGDSDTLGSDDGGSAR